MIGALRIAKQKTNKAPIGVNAEEAGFMRQHYNLVAEFSGASDKVIWYYWLEIIFKD